MEQERNQNAPGLLLQELYDQHNRLVQELRDHYERLGEMMTRQNRTNKYDEWEDGRVLRRRRDPYPAHWKEYQEINQRIRRGKAELAKCAEQIRSRVTEKRRNRVGGQSIY